MSRVTEKSGEDFASSVGRVFREQQIYSVGHPAYQAFSNEVVEELTRISERVAAQKSTARKLVVTSALGPDEVAGLMEDYPEFQVVTMPLNKPVHSYWQASRVAANEWCAVMTDKYASTCVHYGGSMLHAILRKARGTHVESDGCEEVSVHGAHSSSVDMHRIFQDYAKVQSTYGVVLPRAEYDDYLRGKAYGLCSKPNVCSVQAEAMVVDLTMSAVSPVQVALSMLQHGAELCHGFFPYHPVMLVQQKGELPGTGIHFERTVRSFNFKYAEGRVGVESFPRSAYACWLASHSFTVGAGGDCFQLELLKNRGSFMFFRLAKVPVVSGRSVFRHALDLADSEEYSVVHSWRLKQGFGSDPVKGASWEKHDFLVRQRVLRRVREFAMQLQPAQFTRFAIKKQIRVVNNRWVVNGSSVSVAAPLDPREVEDLTTAIFSRAFVDRYDSSQLSSAMMAGLKVVAAFNGSSSAERVAAVAKACASMASDATLGQAEAWLGSFLDTITGLFKQNLSFLSVTEEPCPTYVRLESVIGGFKQVFERTGESLYMSPDHGLIFPIVESAPGGSLGALMRKYNPVSRTSRVRMFRSKVRGEKPLPDSLEAVVRMATDVEDVRLEGPSDADLSRVAKSLNDFDQPSEQRYNLVYERAIRESQEVVREFRYADDPDPVFSLNSLYLELFPSVANQKLEHDTFSLSLDPQDRVLAAPYLRMSTYFGLPPASRSYYKSNLVALNVPKRQNTAPELLTAITARNLSAPVVSLPQEESVVIKDVWENFLNECCVDDAREKLLQYQADPVALAEDMLNDWGKKAKTGVLDAVKKDLIDNAVSLGDKPVDEYLAMLKADVKPTLSTKPVNEVTAPQVIVYHDKYLSAFYSSIFRMLVRRFLSLLKSNYHANLLKDAKDMAAFVTANHPFGRKGLRYLENDFSKFDKSQGRFAFALEEYVFRQLGMNEAYLEKWVDGHVECSIRALSVGLSLHVLYQRKSGDGTTAFGNLIQNILSVSYAYRGTKVLWALYMGDDSLVCTPEVAASAESVQTLAEIFNLTAKYYITGAPYFASCFVHIDDERMEVKFIPDPVKRIERLSMYVAADDPQWDERHASLQDAMQVYRDEQVVPRLAALVSQRYEVSEGLVRGAARALGTLVADKTKFRSLWEQEPSMLLG